MIIHEMTFQNLAFLLIGKLMEDPTQARSYLAVETLAAAFGDED